MKSPIREEFGAAHAAYVLVSIMSVTAGDRAYAQIKGMILGGAFKPGEWLKEETLTARCEMSRTPVREALRRLSAEGFLVASPRHGVQVMAVEPGELAQLYEVRTMLESYAASEAANRLTQAEVMTLRRMVRDMEPFVGREDAEAVQAFQDHVEEFNALLWRASVGGRITATLNLTMEHCQSRQAYAKFNGDDRKRALRQHRELVDALEARDPAWATAVMQSYVHNVYHVLTGGAPFGRL